MEYVESTSNIKRSTTRVSLVSYMFNIFIDNLIDELCLLNSNRYTFVYADDIMVMSENIIKLKENINLIEKWCLENCLKLNKNKCGIIKIISNIR